MNQVLLVVLVSVQVGDSHLSATDSFAMAWLAGGDDGTRTRDLMRDRYVKDIAGVDSTGPWLAADGRYCPSFSLVCGPDVAQLENRMAAHCRRAAQMWLVCDAPCHASSTTERLHTGP